ncbi:hypothetical protein KDL29_13140 [bacterium]|nr:hypothetical protein [bacterium]
MDRATGHLLRETALLALLLLMLCMGSCNRQDSETAATETAGAPAELNAVGDIGLSREDMIIPADTEVSIAVDYHGWAVDSDDGNPADREHIFTVQARWGMNLFEETRELAVREGQADEIRLDIGDGQWLAISPQWNDRQRGSYEFRVEEGDGKVIAVFDAKDTNELESMTNANRNGHHTKTVFADLDKRIFLQEVKPGDLHEFSRKSEFGIAYVGEGYKDMPTCKENANHHWHFPRFELVACPKEWMANYSFKGLGEKLVLDKPGAEGGSGGVQRINWDSVYTPERRCMSGG